MLRYRCLPLVAAAVLLASGPSDAAPPLSRKTTPMADPSVLPPTDDKLQVATFGGGCFWCVEAVFERLQGVEKVISGYSGDERPQFANPTYEMVCSKRTKHVEVCNIYFDPEQVTFAELLEVFWKTHDPTTKNRQGNDVGPQYRSVVFYHDREQKAQAERYKKKLDEAGAYRRPIVTDIEPAVTFYPAEAYHQDYFKKNPFQGYCQAVVRPKVEKFQEIFGDKARTDSPAP